MPNTEVRIFNKSEELPDISQDNFFHSKDLFVMMEQTPGCTPYMAVAYDSDGNILGHLFAVVYRRGSLIPPYLYSNARIYGEGEYSNGVDKNAVFGELMQAFTRLFRRKMCLYVEFSNLSKKMFGYRHFRRQSYFPIRWTSIHNSLHSKAPIERIADKTKKRIDNTYETGVVTREAKDEEEVLKFHSLLRRYYRFKFQRFIPRKELFLQLWNSNHGRIYVTLYKDRIIGGCALVYSKSDAYVWYMASRNKSHLLHHPRTMTIWNALEDSYQKGYEHLRFMNAGLPFSKNPSREAILRFGGKPTSTFRWFRFPFGFINRFVRWFMKE